MNDYDYTYQIIKYNKHGGTETLLGCIECLAMYSYDKTAVMDGYGKHNLCIYCAKKYIDEDIKNLGSGKLNEKIFKLVCDRTNYDRINCNKKL